MGNLRKLRHELNKKEAELKPLELELKRIETRKEALKRVIKESQIMRLREEVGKAKFFSCPAHKTERKERWGGSYWEYSCRLYRTNNWGNTYMLRDRKRQCFRCKLTKREAMVMVVAKRLEGQSEGRWK